MFFFFLDILIEDPERMLEHLYDPRLYMWLQTYNKNAPLKDVPLWGCKKNALLWEPLLHWESQNWSDEYYIIKLYVMAASGINKSKFLHIYAHFFLDKLVVFPERMSEHMCAMAPCQAATLRNQLPCALWRPLNSEVHWRQGISLHTLSQTIGGGIASDHQPSPHNTHIKLPCKAPESNL